MADIYVSKPFVKKEEKQEENVSLDEKEDLTNKKGPIPFRERKSLDFNPIASFAFLPKEVDFETKNRDEKDSFAFEETSDYQFTLDIFGYLNVSCSSSTCQIPNY